MNKSLSLVAPDAVKFLRADDKIVAQSYFQKEYPGIIYHADTDSYEYRGIMFDYFNAGINMYGKAGNTFLLVDKDDPRLWLFNYGEKEEMLRDYLRRKGGLIAICRSLYCRLFR